MPPVQPAKRPEATLTWTGKPLPGALTSSLQRASEHAPYWREQLRHLGGVPADMEAYERMPRLERADLATRPPSEFSSSEESEVVGHFSSSGTTGAALSVPYSKGLMVALSAQFLRMYGMLGLDSASVVALGYGSAQGAAFSMHAFALRKLGIEFFHLSEADPHAAHARLTERRATAIFAPAGYVLGLCRVGGRGAHRQLNHLRAVLCSGMPLSDSGRDFIEETLGAETFRCGGATEISLLACECRQKRGMHLVDELLFAEFLPTDHSDPGLTMLVSSLQNTAYHLFRYHLGDVVVANCERCACGLRTPRIDVLGRANDVVNFCDGDTLLSSSVQSVVNAVSGLTGGFQFTLDTRREPAVAECVAEAWAGDEQTRSACAEALRNGIGFCLADSGGGSLGRRRSVATDIRLVGPGALSAGRPKYRRMLHIQ